MKNFVLGAFSALVVLALGALTYLELGFAPVAADEAPSALEESLMASAVHASVGRESAEISTPPPATDTTLIAGGRLYLNDCVGCHGAPGQPPSLFGATFFPRAPQFPAVGTRYSRFQIFWIAKHGIRMTGMNPQFPGYSEPRLWSLAAFIGRIRDLPPEVARAIQEPASAR